MTAKPTGPPNDGPVVELRPHGQHHRPKVTVYTHPRPALWIYWRNEWEYADVRARHDWDTGTVAYQVEVQGPDGDAGQRSTFSITVLWGPDSVRPANH